MSLGSLRREWSKARAAAGLAGPPEDWPVEDQIDHLADALRVHQLGRSTYAATAREIALLDALIAGGALPEQARGLVEPMNPVDQPEREAWFRRNWRAMAQRREQAEQRLAWIREHGWSCPIPPGLL